MFDEEDFFTIDNDKKEFEKCAKCGGNFFDYCNAKKTTKGSFNYHTIYESELTKVNVLQCIECLTVAKVYPVN